MATNGSVGQYYALPALGEIHARPELVVPALAGLLKDPDVNVRRMCVRGLQSFGVNARPAVPVLVNCLKDQDEYLRKRAAEALKVINPEAAAKVGLK